MKYLQIIVVSLVLMFFSVGIIEAHPGKTDSSGGHTCRTNCTSWGLSTGEYHTHGGSEPINPPEQQPHEKPRNFIPQVAPTKAPAKVFPTKSPVKQAPTTAPIKIQTVKPYVETSMDKKKYFKVLRVIDGDTMEVSIRGKVETVRLLAIDAPEVQSFRSQAKCYGLEATKRLSSLTIGKFVKLVDERTQGNRDKHNRLLRYAYLENDTFINAEMVKQGYAYSYKDYPTNQLHTFNTFENQAREKNVGLWSACKTTSTATKNPSPTQKPQVRSFTGGTNQKQTQPNNNTSSGDKDCGDFATHAQAQAFFKAAGAGDPHRLDADSDGIACETLP